jgi:raffinose/stachyose/melibiose transport system substrate-binding protein
MKKLTAALVVGSVLALTAGCTSASPTTESKSHQTLTVWYNAADAAPYLDVYKRWEKASGNKVKLVSIPADTFQDQVQTRWAAGDRPDILEYHATSLFLALNPAQNLVPLTNEAYVKKSGDLYKSVGSSGGQVYAAITGGLSQFGAFYNKNVLAQNGLEAPQSYADLEHICTVLKQKDPGVIPIWESGGSAWPTQILGGLMYTAQYNIGDKYANRILSKKTQLTDPNGPFVKGMTAYDDLSKAGCFGPQATTQKFEDSIPASFPGRQPSFPWSTASSISSSRLRAAPTRSTAPSAGRCHRRRGPRSPMLRELPEPTTS